jgi:hypothetical protein
MSAPRSLRAAIDAKCRDCIYDPGGGGTWRAQVEACSSADCPLHPLRPVSARKTRVARPKAIPMRPAPVSALHPARNGLPGPTAEAMP